MKIIGLALKEPIVGRGRLSNFTVLIIARETMMMISVVMGISRFGGTIPDGAMKMPYETRVNAPDGMGMPVKYNLSSNPANCTLNRANLYTPARADSDAIKIPIGPRVKSIVLYSKNEGATPNETASHKESNSTPNSLVDLVSRAIVPSSTSNNPASTMNIPALLISPSDMATIAENPEKRLASVNRFGMIERVILM